jgi:hypothetical protein
MNMKKQSNDIQKDALFDFAGFEFKAPKPKKKAEPRPINTAPINQPSPKKELPPPPKIFFDPNARIKLKVEEGNQKRIWDYLEANASDVLVEKINAGHKTMKGCWKYITGEAQKQAVSGCACIDDDTVFGWGIHYFEEDEIKEDKPKPKQLNLSLKAPAKKRKARSKKVAK